MIFLNCYCQRYMLFIGWNIGMAGKNCAQGLEYGLDMHVANFMLV